MIMSENNSKFFNSWHSFKSWPLSRISGKKIHFVNSLVKGSGQASVQTTTPHLFRSDCSCSCWRERFSFFNPEAQNRAGVNSSQLPPPISGSNLLDEGEVHLVCEGHLTLGKRHVIWVTMSTDSQNPER